MMLKRTAGNGSGTDRTHLSVAKRMYTCNRRLVHIVCDVNSVFCLVSATVLLISKIDVGLKVFMIQTTSIKKVALNE
jgi:hypothetical protein